MSVVAHTRHDYPGAQGRKQNSGRSRNQHLMICSFRSGLANSPGGQCPPGLFKKRFWTGVSAWRIGTQFALSNFVLIPAKKLLYISREEIAIMRLVGANNTFVRMPFVVEGIMYGMVAAIVSTALFYPVTLWLRGATEDFYGGIDLFRYYITNLNQIFLILLGVGVALGAISSYLAVKRYLKV